MNWALINADGETVGKITQFPASRIPAEHRLSYKNTIFHNSGSVPATFFVTFDGTASHAEAKYIPGAPRGKWQVFAWGHNEAHVHHAVKEVINLTQKS